MDLPSQAWRLFRCREVTGDGLVIQGERKREHEEERGGVHQSERSYGSFYRSIPLPEGASIERRKHSLTMASWK
jgi:HSP20 family molecular chaperone IbpA